MNLALESIRYGNCKQAIVAGSMCHLLPTNALPFHRLNMMSEDGKCKSFDASGNLIISLNTYKPNIFPI